MTKPPICIIIAYYGKWPAYLPLFLKGCEHNKHVLDVVLITDIKDSSIHFPSNVKTVDYSLQEVANRVENLFSIKTSNFRPYKMCDLKPAYAHLFPEIVEGYGFWGFGDIDLIYGGLSRYFTERALKKYDILTFRDEWISGALTVLRNSEKTNTLFTRSTDYLSTFSSPVNHAFDECGKKHGILRTGVHPLDIVPDYSKKDVNCFTQVVSKAEEDGDITVYQKEQVKESLPFNEILWHIDGKLLAAGNREVALFHAVWEKKFSRFTVPNWKIVPENLFITATGFYAFPTRFWKVTHYFRLMRGALQDLSKRVRTSLEYRLRVN